jgi:hypothetical protein
MGLEAASAELTKRQERIAKDLMEIYERKQLELLLYPIFY